MKINAINIRVGNLIEYNGKLWSVQKTMHTQPGKGGAYMQVEMKDIREGTKNNVRFRSSETVEKIQLEQREYSYLYDNEDNIEVMDKVSFEQISLSKSLVGDRLPFLQDSMDITVEYYGDVPITVVFPETIVLSVSTCEPVVKGQTAASSYKPAVLENGVRIMVPPFINQGDKVLVKIESQEYMERAK
jgi:elongation factor P